MAAFRFTAVVLVPALLMMTGCGGDRWDRPLPPAEPASVPASTPPPASDSSSTGAGRPSVPAQEPGTPRRGNTPPGMDRSGGGPADGAIKDPSGAATGTPERR